MEDVSSAVNGWDDWSHKGNWNYSESLLVLKSLFIQRSVCGQTDSRITHYEKNIEALECVQRMAKELVKGLKRSG